MHRRRGARIFSLSRYIQVRTTATATKQAVNVRSNSWEIPNSRPTAPSPLTTSAPAGLGKWAPPISKWARPESQKPPVKAEDQNKPLPQRRNQRVYTLHDQGHKLKPSASFIEPRIAHAPGKWSRPPGFPPTNSTPSTSATPVVGDTPTSSRLKVEERGGWADLRQDDPGTSESHRSFVRPREDDHAARQNRRWEGTGKHKSRGSLLSRHTRDGVIPHQPRVQDMKAASKPKAQKPKKALRVNPDIDIPSTVSVGNFARLLNVSLGRLQRVMANAGMEGQSSYDHVLTAEYASLLAMEFGRNPIVNDEAAFDIYPPPTHPEPSTLPLRSPIVTIMGHVDHGKTTLLDKLRSTSVAKGEAGGITQHIGAFSVPVPASSGEAPKSITFLDTPGHAAFSAMRARGASMTDIVVLVVAADDGIMPQTKEVLDLIQREKLNAVVAINKVDKPGVDIENVQNALLAEGVQLEAFGGDIPCVPVSGLTGKGLDDLVETISLIAETQELRAERDGDIQGYILESKIRKGLGPVATVLLLRGCLRPGAHIICGTHYGKVRSMLDSSDKSVKAAYPGMAVTVTGWKSLPNAGDEVLQGAEADVKKAISNRERKADLEERMEDLEAINEQRRLERDRREAEAAEETSGDSTNRHPGQEQGPKELRLVVKGDVSGSVEAVVDALQCIGNKEAYVKIIASGVGDVTESDVFRAQVAQGTIVAFTVSIPRSVEVLAKQHSVPLISSKVIYSLIDDIRSRVIQLLPSIIETKVTGEANVLQLFDIRLKTKQIMKVAGCRVSNGVMEKSKHIRVVRNRETVFEGNLDTFKHLKKDITEAGKGLDCGISISGFDGLEVGDLIQAFEKIEKPGIL